MKKVLILMFLLVLVVFLASCSKSEKDAITYNSEPNGSNENRISILLPYFQSDATASTKKYLNSVAKAKGYEIDFISINAPNYDSYLLKRNVELFKDEGITLLLFNSLYESNDLKEKDIILSIESSIENSKNIEGFCRNHIFFQFLWLLL